MLRSDAEYTYIQIAERNWWLTEVQVEQSFHDIADYFHDCAFGKDGVSGRYLLYKLEQIVTSRLLKNVGALTILNKGNLLNYVCVHWDPLSELDVLSSSRSSLHYQQVQSLLIFNPLNFIQRT
jgi:hypothetical protein